MNRVERLWAVPVSVAQIHLISGHESRKSLEVYHHLFPDTTDEAY
jgi:hypothetical protein